MAPARPDVIADRYELTGQVVAAGGMGQVLVAKDLLLQREVAVKVLSDGAADIPTAHRRFRQEAEAAARLSHPNVVAVYDAGVHEGRPFIVMERLSGRTFADEIAAGPVPSQRARRIGKEVLSALECSHSLGIIHRDIKPQNVLIDDEGSARLADFGIAKSLESDLTRTRDVLGTPAYLAPELLEGAMASPSSDIFGVGVMLYEAVAGRKPFAGDTPWALAAAVRSGRLTPLHDVVPWIDSAYAAAVARALAADPADRFPTAAEMVSALETEPTSAPHTPSAPSSTDQTMVLPSADAAATVAIRETSKAPAHRPRRVGLLPIMVGIAVLVMVLIGLATVVSRDQPQATLPSQKPAPAATTTVPRAPLPPSLADAMDELQDAVTP